MSYAAIPRVVYMGGLLWIGAAILLGATGALAAVPPPGPQIVILALTVGLYLATRTAGVRAWVDTLSLRLLVGLHGVRFVGIVFLLLAAQGSLSPIFAERAGWGDIVAAVVALALVLTGMPNSEFRRWAYMGWNAFGVLDLLVAVGTATLVFFRGDVPGMEPLMQLPLIIVPMFLVPVLLVSHIIIFQRLSKKDPESHGA